MKGKGKDDDLEEGNLLVLTLDRGCMANVPLEDVNSEARPKGTRWSGCNACAC